MAGASVIEEPSARALAKFDTEARFRARAARGDREAALALLDGLDEADGQRLPEVDGMNPHDPLPRPRHH